MALSAQNPQDRAEQLLSLTERLTMLILKETEALNERRLNASSTDWQEKETLAHAYRVELARISKDPSLMEGITPEVKTQLQTATKAFHELLDQHAVALGAMKTLSEGLVQTVAEEVRRVKAGPQGYGAAGQVSNAATPSGIAVNAKA